VDPVADLVDPTQAVGARRHDTFNADGRQRRLDKSRRAWRRGMARRIDGYQVTVAPLLVEQDNAWQKLLLGGFNNIRVAAHWVRQFGLPDTSVADKLPYWR